MSQKTSDFRNKVFLKQYRKRPLAHPYIVFPALLKILGSIRGKKVIDIGCGMGEVAALLAQKGAHVFAVDKSAEAIKICRQQNRNMKNLEFAIRDGADLRTTSKSFDIALLNMVFLNVASKKKLRSILKEAGRVLQSGGKFIFTDIHPACLIKQNTATEKITYLRNFSYFKDSSRYRSRVLLTDNTTIKFTDVHWTLATYFKSVKAGHMYIEDVVEPRPVNKSPLKLKNYITPEYIIFCCRKFN